MSFRLALVGHGSSIREIQEIVAETFENIETVGIEMPSDERVDEAAQALRRCLPELDGVLYTRSEPYKLMVSRVDHGAVLARYVNVDAASFVHALLIAQSKYHADIYRVSVDTLDYVTVMKTYRSLELDMDHVQPVSISVDTNGGAFCRRNDKDAPRELPQWPVQRLHYKYPQRAGHARSRGHPLRADGAERIIISARCAV